MDTVYPEPTSLLYRRPVRKLRGNAARYRTQPVTFAEIQEVDEENLEDIPETTQVTMKKNTNSEVDINRKFDEFKRIRDMRLSSKNDNDTPSLNESSKSQPVTKYSSLASIDVENQESNSKLPTEMAIPGKLLQRPSL